MMGQRTKNKQKEEAAEGEKGHGKGSRAEDRTEIPQSTVKWRATRGLTCRFVLNVGNSSGIFLIHLGLDVPLLMPLPV